MNFPDPNEKFPLPGYEKLCFLKNSIDSELIEVGDYTMMSKNCWFCS